MSFYLCLIVFFPVLYVPIANEILFLFKCVILKSTHFMSLTSDFHFFSFFCCRFEFSLSLADRSDTRTHHFYILFSQVRQVDPAYMVMSVLVLEPRTFFTKQTREERTHKHSIILAMQQF